MFPIMSVVEEIRGLFRKRLLQLFTLAVLTAGLGGYCFTLKYCVLDLDLWWHLGVGNWILQHHGVPRTGILSLTAATRPWVAYSWGYEVLLSLTYRWFGLLGVGILGVLLTLVVAICLYWMLRRLSGRFWVATALTVVSCWAFLFSDAQAGVLFHGAIHGHPYPASGSSAQRQNADAVTNGATTNINRCSTWSTTWMSWSISPARWPDPSPWINVVRRAAGQPVTTRYGKV